MVMLKSVNPALKDKVWTFKAKAIGPQAKAIKFGFEAKTLHWTRSEHDTDSVWRTTFFAQHSTLSLSK